MAMFSGRKIVNGSRVNLSDLTTSQKRIMKVYGRLRLSYRYTIMANGVVVRRGKPVRG